MHETVMSLFVAFPYAVLTGILVAVVCAMLGVFVILKRVVFIGITLSEMAACGIAAAMLAGVPSLVGSVIFTLLAVGVLAFPFESRRIPRDAVLGVLFIAASSLSVLLVSHSGIGLHEIKALLYGDLILTSGADLCSVSVVLLPALAYVLVFVRPTLYAFLDREAATVLGVKPAGWEILFFVVLGVVVAAASKVAGALLVFAYLVIPAAVALLLVRRIWLVLAVAAATAVVVTLSGLYVSFAADLPTNQTVCILAVCVFLVAVVWRGLRALWLRFARREPDRSA